MLPMQCEPYLPELLVLPELVFQDVLNGFHIMICSPLHLHGTAAWKLVYLHILLQRKPAIAFEDLRSKLVTHAYCMERHV